MARMGRGARTPQTFVGVASHVESMKAMKKMKITTVDVGIPKIADVTTAIGT